MYRFSFFCLLSLPPFGKGTLITSTAKIIGSQIKIQFESSPRFNTRTCKAVTLFRNTPSFGAHHERGRSQMTLVSDNVRFMRIFAGVPCRGVVRRQWGNQKRQFSFRTLRLRHFTKWGQHYYIVEAPCRLSTDPKIHDLEWPFYIQFSIFTITNLVSAIRLHIYCRAAIYRIFLLYDVTSRDVQKLTLKRDLQNIVDQRKDCRSFVDEKLRALHHWNLDK